MDLHQDVRAQLRLLGDLRDVFEKSLALSRKSAARGQPAAEETIRRIGELLLAIQTRRSELLVQPAAMGAVIGGELDRSRAILETAADLLKGMAALYPPLYSPFHDALANIEAMLTPRREG